MTNTYWNAEVYDRIGTPMRSWAQAAINLPRPLSRSQSRT